jgi:hypothetical protein
MEGPGDHLASSQGLFRSPSAFLGGLADSTNNQTAATQTMALCPGRSGTTAHPYAVTASPTRPGRQALSGGGSRGGGGEEFSQAVGHLHSRLARPPGDIGRLCSRAAVATTRAHGPGRGAGAADRLGAAGGPDKGEGRSLPGGGGWGDPDGGRGISG